MRALGTDTCFWLSKQVQYNARFAEQSVATLPLPHPANARILDAKGHLKKPILKAS
jgi:hypothetical protein